MDYKLQEGVLLYKGRLVIPYNPGIKLKLLKYLHDDPTAGHGGLLKTLHKAYKDFFWPGMKKDIGSYIQSCTVCQTCKHSQDKPAELLQPLPIPNETWTHVSMEFIEGLPTSQGKSVIWVIVDRLS